MATRLGIELSSSVCRIVELDGGLDFRHDQPETRVTAFAMMPRDADQVAARLMALRGRHATAVVWAPGADHRPVVVAGGAYDRMRAEARAALLAAGRGSRRTLADIAPGVDLPKRISREDGRRTVLLASAPADEVAALLRPLVEAGIRIDHVLTPAAALVSLARTRRSLARCSAIEAYVALDETAACVALVQGGVLVAATGLPWGFVDERGGHRSLHPRDDIAARLAADLSAFLNEGGVDRDSLQHICVSGGLPELRSMAMTLMERLDIEVEPLDSLFAVEATRLPENAEDCRAHLPALRLAWAAAADEHPPLDLFRLRRWQARRTYLARVAVVAGTAAGLALGLAIQDRVRPASPESSMRVLAASALPLGPVIGSVRSESASAGHPQRVAPRAVFRTRKEPAFAALALRRAEPANAPPAPVGRSPADTPPAPVGRSPAEVPVVPPVLPRVVPRAEPASAPLALRRGKPVSATNESPLPLEAALESILVGPDRCLAIVDGRIVQPGDIVRGARVVEISATAVLLRDERGRLRQLTSAGVRR